MTEKEKFIRAVCFLNTQRDSDIIAWLNAQGNKSAAMRAALNTHVQSQLIGASDAAGQHVAINPEIIRQTMSETLAENFNPAILRQLMEAALRSVLAEMDIAASNSPESDETNVSTLVDNLDNNFFL